MFASTKNVQGFRTAYRLLRPISISLITLCLSTGSDCFQAHGANAPTKSASSPAGPEFYFTGPEAFPLESFIGELRSADINGDGFQDIIVANNAKARVTLLINRAGKPAEVDNIPLNKRRDVNELPPDARFKIDSVTSEKRISGLIVADLNDDQKPDIAYFGEPTPLELVVHYNETKDGVIKWASPKRWSIEGGQLSPNGLALGDLNGDKKNDVVILADSHVAILYQQKDKTLAEPEKIPFTGSVKSVQVFDVNGDGRDDLVLVNWEASNPIRFRLQDESGGLGPEIHFSTSPIRSYVAENLLGDAQTELVTIAQTSGRAQMWRFERRDAAILSGSLAQGQFQVLPLTKSGKGKRGVAWGDINGDERTDLVVAQPETGQLTIHLQDAQGNLGPGRTFPSLAGITDIAISSNGKGQAASIYLLSADERQVGTTSLNQEGRLPFPTVLPLDGKPLAMALGSLQSGAPVSLALIIEKEDRKHLWLRSANGSIKTQKLGTNLKTNPNGLLLQDVDQDGLTDLVVLVPYEKLKILRQVKDKDFAEIDVAPPGGTVDQPWASTADVDGDGQSELLLAQKNFLRAVVLKQAATVEGAATNASPTAAATSSSSSSGNWSLVVKDQINGASASSRIVAAAPLVNGSKKVESLFLLDADRKALVLCERDATGVWNIIRTLNLPFTDFTELKPLALGGQTRNAIGFVGASAVGWLSLTGKAWELVSLDGYETPIKDGRLADLVVGDLNHDKQKDLVFLEIGRNHLDIVSLDKQGKMIPGNRWQVFEERSFRSRRGEGSEPREACIQDFNGDGLNDLAILVHDRILLYLQPKD